LFTRAVFAKHSSRIAFLVGSSPLSKAQLPDRELEDRCLAAAHHMRLADCYNYRGRLHPQATTEEEGEMSQDTERWLRKVQGAIVKAIEETFDTSDWKVLGMKTGTSDYINGDPRLLRSMRFVDADYPGNVVDAVHHMLQVDLDNLQVMLDTPKIAEWLRENEPGLVGGSTTEPGVDHATAIHRFLWRPAADSGLTKGFDGQRHDDLLRRLRDRAEPQLPGSPSITLLQSLQDAGCDILFKWGEAIKYGVQLKSHYDISQGGFAANTIAQIQDSRQHGLLRLYVLLATDLTSRSHEEKVRGFEARISKQNDPYVVTVSPDRLWTLLFGEED
jgi:hypothetical protein